MNKDARVALAHALREGLTRDDRRGVPILYRFLQPTDDVTAITDLLHRAYAPLAAVGLHYVASHQSPEVTRRRMAKGDTVVAVAALRIIGVITLAAASATDGSPFYDRRDVAHFGQFAVEPAYQRTGVGSALLALIEELARERGVGELGLDTSEHASDLIQFYESRGYRHIEFAQWPEVNYRSVIMAKVLEPSGTAI
jgi:GNAT superfamily N-acetyltransferase